MTVGEGRSYIGTRSTPELEGGTQMSELTGHGATSFLTIPGGFLLELIQPPAIAASGVA